jgi:uncharacterized glyoxalase superfamily protein PhnB
MCHLAGFGASGYIDPQHAIMNTKTEHQVVVPYFMVKSAPKFIGFARAVFNAELVESKTGENDEDIIHAEIKIGGSRIFVADSGQCGGVWISPGSPEGTCSTSDGGKPIQMFAHVKNVDETCRRVLASGGSVVMEPYDDDNGRMCAVADPFENLWWLKSEK